MQRELDIPNNIGLLEVEDTLKRLQSHKGVEGILIITKSGMFHDCLQECISTTLLAVSTNREHILKHQFFVYLHL